jgi:hypothetical protein
MKNFNKYIKHYNYKEKIKNSKTNIEMSKEYFLKFF